MFFYNATYLQTDTLGPINTDTAYGKSAMANTQYYARSNDPDPSLDFLSSLTFSFKNLY